MDSDFEEFAVSDGSNSRSSRSKKKAKSSKKKKKGWHGKLFSPLSLPVWNLGLLAEQANYICGLINDLVM